jgi:hypothetical protein
MNKDALDTFALTEGAKYLNKQTRMGIRAGILLGAEWARANPPKCETCARASAEKCIVFEVLDKLYYGVPKGFGCTHHKAKKGE